VTAAAADLSRAAAMIELGRYGDAARLLAALLASAPDSSRGWCLLARARLGAGDPAAAVAAAARASTLDPANDWPYRLASTALLGLDRSADAVAAAVVGQRLAPHFWRAHVCLAQAAAADGQLALAAEAARAALAIAPDQADVQVTAGKVALAQGDVAEARARQEAALAIEPAHGSAINELGRISLRSRDAAAAAGHFLRAARTAPGNGIFGRNTELALRRLALWVAAPLLLAGSIGAAAVMAALARIPGLAAGLAAVAGLLVLWMAARIRSVPPDARRPLARLIGARGGQLGRSLRTAFTGARKIRKNLQGGNAPASGSGR